MGALHSLYHLNRLQRRLHWSPERLEQLRSRKMKALLHFCYWRIPYYREQFKRIGAEPRDFRTPEDLVRFPIVEKQTLRDHAEEFIDLEADRSRLLKYNSSGSTGIPLELWYHPTERQRMGFTMTREFLLHGLKPYHRLVNVTEPRHASPKDRWYHKLGLMNEKFLSIYDPPDKILAELRQINPHLLIGFPSVLLLVGKQMQEQDAKGLRPRLLFTLAEVLTSQDREILKEQWGVEPIDLYGCNETGHIAFQCTRREGYHINVDSVHVEVVNGDKPVGAGERGEVIVTNFDLRIMPIIRYRVGDIVRKLPDQCSCGCQFPLLGEIAGRSDGFLIGVDGRLFSALEVSLLLHRLPGISQYRLLQHDPGAVTVEWVPKDPNFDPESEIRRALEQSLGDKMKIEIRRIAEIPREKSGKIRTVVSSLPHPFGTKN
ncbi:MAG: hypothetical protein NTW14_04775 [bacterium]|nr:hypothetical protein [bacterium]